MWGKEHLETDGLRGRTLCRARRRIWGSIAGSQSESGRSGQQQSPLRTSRDSAHCRLDFELVANGERVKFCEWKYRLGYFMLELQKIYTIDPCSVAFPGDTRNKYLCIPARVLMTDQSESSLVNQWVWKAYLGRMDGGLVTLPKSFQRAPLEKFHPTRVMMYLKPHKWNPP